MKGVEPRDTSVCEDLTAETYSRSKLSLRHVCRVVIHLSRDEERDEEREVNK